MANLFKKAKNAVKRVGKVTQKIIGKKTYRTLGKVIVLTNPTTISAAAINPRLTGIKNDSARRQVATIARTELAVATTAGVAVVASGATVAGGTSIFGGIADGVKDGIKNIGKIGGSGSSDSALFDNKFLLIGGGLVLLILVIFAVKGKK